MTTTSTPRILSIQSHTVHGFVGNKAVTFPLQTMGFDVNAINTITLSNHPAYSKGTKGQSLDADVLKQIFTGLEDNSLLRYEVIMTGYTRFTSHLEHIAAVVKQIRQTNPHAIYVCDPVLGDNEQYYVPTELLVKYQELLLPLATVITPNIFESQVLSGVTITSQEEAVQAAMVLHQLGPSVVVMTGLPITAGASQLSILLSYLPSSSSSSSTSATPSSSPQRKPIIYRIDVPKLEGYYAGCGDLFSALITSAIASTSTSLPHDHHWEKLLPSLLDLSSETMTEVLRKTRERNSRELCIVESRDLFIGLQERLRQLLLPILSAPRPPTAVHPSHRSYLISHPKALGVIDGTLTEPGAIDFQAMYDRIGLKRTKGSDILSLVNALPTETERDRAMEIIFDEEMKGIERQVMREGLTDVLAHLTEKRRLRLALCTRNCEKAYLQFLAQSKIHEKTFLPAFFRESTDPTLQKPNPALATLILDIWGASQVPEEEKKLYWFVGDSIDDMKCGKLAGLTTVLIRTEENHALAENHPKLVDHVIHRLEDLLPLLE